MQAYPWALSPQKLERAIIMAGVDASEDAIKEKYVLLGGKVTEVEAPQETHDKPRSKKNVKPTAKSKPKS